VKDYRIKQKNTEEFDQEPFFFFCSFALCFFITALRTGTRQGCGSEIICTWYVRIPGSEIIYQLRVQVKLFSPNYPLYGIIYVQILITAVYLDDLEPWG
jgi:hypothetical protein